MYGSDPLDHLIPTTLQALPLRSTCRAQQTTKQLEPPCLSGVHSLPLFLLAQHLLWIADKTVESQRIYHQNQRPRLSPIACAAPTMGPMKLSSRSIIDIGTTRTPYLHPLRHHRLSKL